MSFGHVVDVFWHADVDTSGGTRDTGTKCCVAEAERGTIDVRGDGG